MPRSWSTAPQYGTSPTKGHQLPGNDPEMVGQIRLPELQPREQRSPDVVLSTVGPREGREGPSEGPTGRRAQVKVCMLNEAAHKIMSS